MGKPVIKNIFWDVDGVLANLNFAYFNFLTKHPNYKDKYGNIEWEDLPKVLPISPKYGALELKTHPEMGTQMDLDFCQNLEFFNNRPLYPNVVETLKELDKLGYKQFTMSATFDVETKKKLLNKLLAEVKDFLTIEAVQHGQFMHDTAKEDMLKDCFKRYGIKAEETVLVDDRIYNQMAAINVGAHPVRLRCEFTTDLPEELKWIPEVKDVVEFKKWLLENTVKE
ncbi:MAG: HAD family hydrolase [Lactobacillus sp.]|jgi:FMN phosphatase YigB (HAD superfamily)|nr:HAD family hydrolase [Lactobacillus sp.]